MWQRLINAVIQNLQNHPPGHLAHHPTKTIISIYKISSPENNHSTKLVISVRAVGKPPAGWITNFVLIIFWASYVIYLYNIHWLLHIHCRLLGTPRHATRGPYGLLKGLLKGAH